METIELGGRKFSLLCQKKNCDSEDSEGSVSDEEEELIFSRLMDEKVPEEILEKEIKNLFDVIGESDDESNEEPKPSTSKTPLTSPQKTTMPVTPVKRPPPASSKRKAPPQKKTMQCKKKKVDMGFQWTDENFRGEVQIPEDVFQPPPEELTPLDYFKKFFSDEAIDLIHFQSNLCGVQKTSNPIQLSKTDILDFLGVELFMGVVTMPAYTDYWALPTRFDKIAQIMSLKKYEYIRRYLHFSNNLEESDDRYKKVRDLLEIIRKNCSLIPNEKRQSIDEMMIPYKGKKAGSRKQYLKSKPKKWGYKVFVRAGVSGIVYDFMLYDGTDTFRNINFSNFENNFSMAPKVILALTKSIQDAPLSAIYFDNFFTTLPLLAHLREEYGVLCLGTVRENRLGGLLLETEKSLKKKGRGAYCSKTDNNKKVVVVKWLDNKPVTLASTFVGVDPVVSKKRWAKKEKSKVDVPCPQVVVQYNEHMGGVDLCDMLVALYRTELRTHKWYMAIFSQFLDICVNNAWLLHREEVGKKMQ